MESLPLICAALPLNEKHSSLAIVIGSRIGLRTILGSRYEKLVRGEDPTQLAAHEEAKCMIADENMQLYFTEDPFLEPVTAGGIITRMLFERYEKRLPGMYLLTCVPVRQNSLHLKETVISYAAHWGLPASFLKWLIDENTWNNTFSDCSEWVIETKQPMPLPEINGLICYAPDLKPYYERNRYMLGCAAVLVSTVGMLCGLIKVSDIMRNTHIRTLLGNLLTQEVPEILSFSREQNLEYAAKVCTYLENACGQDSWPEIGNQLLQRFRTCALPALTRYVQISNKTPDCLCFLLSGIIMLYAGVRKGPSGEYSLYIEEEEAPVIEEGDALAAFSRLSCDMAPDSLAYAALSDIDIWGCDLREIPGVESKVTGQLQDMQIIGILSAIDCINGRNTAGGK